MGIKTWYFTCPYTKDRRTLYELEIDITPRASFASDYSACSLVPPSFDPIRDEITFFTKQGLFTYNLDGKRVPLHCLAPSASMSLYAVSPFNQRVLTCDEEKGACYWGPDGRLIRRFNLTTYSIFLAHFISKEFVICIDVTLGMHIVDTRLGTIFTVAKLEERPFRVFYQRLEHGHHY
jgi:hypothetical protein